MSSINPGAGFLFTNNIPGVRRLVMGRSKPKPQSELDAMKALVAVYGTREAARVSGIPYGTISCYAFKYKWRKAAFRKQEGSHEALAGKDAAEVLTEALQKHREDSTLNLAKYVDKAARDAARHGNPLDVARKVRDVAGVHQILFPKEEETGLIEGAILLGLEKPEIDTKEIEDAKAEGAEIIDVEP